MTATNLRIFNPEEINDKEEWEYLVFCMEENNSVHIFRRPKDFDGPYYMKPEDDLLVGSFSSWSETYDLGCRIAEFLDWPISP